MKNTVRYFRMLSMAALVCGLAFGVSGQTGGRSGPTTLVLGLDKEDDSVRNAARKFSRQEILGFFDTDGDGDLSEDERKAGLRAIQRVRDARKQAAAAAVAAAEAAKKASAKPSQRTRASSVRTGVRRSAVASKNNIARRTGTAGAASAARAALLKEADKNGNGRIDADERTAYRDAIVRRNAGGN